MITKIAVGVFSLLALVLISTQTASAGYCENNVCNPGPPAPGTSPCTENSQCADMCNHAAGYVPQTQTSDNSCKCLLGFDPVVCIPTVTDCDAINNTPSTCQPYLRFPALPTNQMSCIPDGSAGTCVTDTSIIDSDVAEGCLSDINGVSGIRTGLGCIPIGSTQGFVEWFIGWAIGIAGGIAFLLILGAGYQIMTAQGKPEQLQGGRELLTAAISGLTLIIFSVFLLRLIGHDIFNLPGFGQP